MHCPMQRMLPAVLLAFGTTSLDAQTIDDHLMMPRKQLCTGFVYMHDSWDRYWEGPLERGNGNIGTLTTQSVSWMGTYGVTDRLNVIAMVPWVTTGASAGTASGMDGVQDLTAAVKWNALDTPLTGVGNLQAFLVASGSVPLGDYTPDFLPMSIGLHSNARLGAALAQLPGEAGLVRRGHGRLHLARHGDAGPAVVLHGRPALPDRPGGDAGRDRLHVPRRLLEARPLRAGLLHADDHARGLGHPPAGHAVRLQPHELVPPRRAGHVLPEEAEEPRGAARRELRVSGRNVGQSTTLWPASSTPSSSRHREPT